MGMLLHHTWLEQQKQAHVEKEQEKPVEAVKAEEPVKETAKAPVKRAGGRRKTK